MATLSQPSHFQYNFDIPSPTHHTAMDQHSPNDESRRPSHPSEQSSQDEYSLSGSLPTDWLDYLDATTNSTLNTAPNVSVTVSQPLYTGTGTGTGTHGVIYGFDPLYLPVSDTYPVIQLDYLYLVNCYFGELTHLNGIEPRLGLQ